MLKYRKSLEIFYCTASMFNRGKYNLRYMCGTNEWYAYSWKNTELSWDPITMNKSMWKILDVCNSKEEAIEKLYDYWIELL